LEGHKGDKMTDCKGEHNYFIAETCAVVSEGSLTVVAVCTHCGDVIHKTIPVSKGNQPLLLKSETKEI
jgi:rRNA maturation protein Nop10